MTMQEVEEALAADPQARANIRGHDLERWRANGKAERIARALSEARAHLDRMDAQMKVDGWKK